MRKILNIMAIALAIFCRIPVEVHGQSFLKKLKQKVGNVVGTKDDTAEIGEEPFVGGDGDQPTRSVTPTDKLQKRRTATATWDEMIAPSRANSPEALLNELPPLPSVESIVYPEETARATYYRKIVAVDMRITELDSIHTCSDEEMIALRDKFYVELADINGITVEEMKSLEDPNLPEAEKERLIEKMKNALVGDTRGLEAMGADLEKREAAKGGKLTNEEKMAFLAENQGNLSDLGSMMEKMQATNEKTTAFNAKFVKLEQMTVQQTEKMKKILQASDGAITSCEKIAGEYESELKTLYAQIYETDDSQKVEELYARADERMKNYRLRAAKLWRNSLQTQLDGVKAMYPDIVKLQKEMMQEGIIPACAEKRASFNAVTNYTNILHKAYCDFLQPRVLPVYMETIIEIPEGEHLFYAESGFATSVDGFLNNSRVYTADNAGKRYLYENGKKRELGPNDPGDFQAKGARTEPTYGAWTSASGTRKVTYTRDGSLTLHDGTSFYPLAFKKESDRLVWIIASSAGVEKCTYKL